MKHYKSVDFLANFRMSILTCTNVVSQLKTFWRWFCW